MRNASPLLIAHFYERFRGLPNSQVMRIAAWLLATIIVILSVVPPDLRPETGVPHYLEHFAIYWATGFAFGLGYERNRGLLAIPLVAFSGAVELAQLIVPGRHARISDFLVDAIAISIGVLTAAQTERIRGRA
jgi:VanZ family protein